MFTTDMRHKRASEKNEDAWVGGCKSERVAEEWFPLINGEIFGDEQSH